jgi:hypothetical protein
MHTPSYFDQWRNQAGSDDPRPVSSPLPGGSTWQMPDALAESTALAERRRGLLGAWLDLVAPPPAPLGAPLLERERVRRAELSGYVLLGVLLVGLALIPNGLANLPTLASAVIIIISAGVAALLNRTDHTTSAALVLIAAFTLALGGALLWAPQLDLMWMPALDFFAVPVLLAAILLSRRAPFIVGAVNIAIITTLLVLKPRDPALAAMVASLGIYHFVIRPAMLILIVAIAGWLWSRSVEQAIARADRAEEVAAAEHELARQKVQLERGIQGLLETHVRLANGDFTARAHAGQENVLWQIAVSLNNLVSRMGQWARVEQRLRQTDGEIDRLAVSLERARQGQPALWPALGGTHVDRLTLLLATSAPTRGQREVGTAPAGQMGQMGPTGAPFTPQAAPRIAFSPPPGSAPGNPVAAQWREASVQHVAPRPPLDAPAARMGQMPAGPGPFDAGASGAWVAPAHGRAAAHDPLYGPPAAHGQTFARLEAMPPAVPPAMPSRRERAQAYRQVPMPDWLAANLPPLVPAERAAVAEVWRVPATPAPDPHGEPRDDARDDAAARDEASATHSASALDMGASGTPAPGAATPAGTIEMSAMPLPGQAKPERAARTRELARETSEPASAFAEPEDAAPDVDWPGFLRGLAQPE